MNGWWKYSARLKFFWKFGLFFWKCQGWSLLENEWANGWFVLFSCGCHSRVGLTEKRWGNIVKQGQLLFSLSSLTEKWKNAKMCFWENESQGFSVVCFVAAS
jgi:hypothetical protein